MPMYFRKGHAEKSGGFGRSQVAATYRCRNRRWLGPRLPQEGPAEQPRYRTHSKSYRLLNVRNGKTSWIGAPPTRDTGPKGNF